MTQTQVKLVQDNQPEPQLKRRRLIVPAKQPQYKDNPFRGQRHRCYPTTLPAGEPYAMLLPADSNAVPSTLMASISLALEVTRLAVLAHYAHPDTACDISDIQDDLYGLHRRLADINKREIEAQEKATPKTKSPKE